MGDQQIPFSFSIEDIVRLNVENMKDLHKHLRTWNKIYLYI